MINTQKVNWWVAVISYACATVALGGCGASMPSKPIHGNAAGLWAVHLPSTPGPFASMAYGREGAGDAAKAVGKPAQLDAYLKPEYRGRASPRVTAPAPIAAAKTAAPMLVAKTAAYEPPRQVVASAEPVSAAAPAAASDAQRYAQREAMSTKQQEFKAGDVLVISLAGVVVVVLIVVLLILLLR